MIFAIIVAVVRDVQICFVFIIICKTNENLLKILGYVFKRILEFYMFLLKHVFIHACTHNPIPDSHEHGTQMQP